jgi:hypothetical protein
MEKKKSSVSDDDLFTTKSQPTKTKISDDKHTLSTNKSSVPKFVSDLVIVSSVKKPAPTIDENGENEIFDISEKH